MTDFERWCDPLSTQSLDAHTIGVLISHDDDAGIGAVAASLGEKYAEADTLVHIAAKFGKSKVSAFLQKKFPTKASARSGDVGEILASAYLQEGPGYEVGPSRLIDRDHQEWAMRGDDVLGVKVGDPAGIRIAKVESKSRKKMTDEVIAQAREGLERAGGMPSPHSLAQFAERLRRSGEESLADAVLELQLVEDIRAEDVLHVMFLFTTNDTSVFVKDDLSTYTGAIEQLCVTLRVAAHPRFIGTVYKKALDCDA